jgi:putative transposase
MGNRHHVHSNGEGYRLPHRHRRLVQPQGPGLAGVDYNEADFCVEALEEALARFGKPEIFNTDQGSQFTSMAFNSVLLREEIACRMDRRGAWRDNVIVERLWRSVKYEEVYLRAYGSVSEARASIGRYLGFFNARRPHSSLAAKTPDQIYFDNLTVMMAT